MSILTVIKWLVPWLIGILKERTPDNIDRVLDAIAPIIEEMLDTANEKGVGQLSPAFRAPYEARMALVLRDLGLL